MAQVSQNGWPVSQVAPPAKPKWITGRWLTGDVNLIFEYLCAAFDTRVEKIDPAASWGWAVRTVRGSTAISNHASGTAVDLNAPKHPLGKQGTFTPAQVTQIRAILRELDGVVRWGGDYAGRKDEMHFEINAGAAKVAAVARKLEAPATPVLAAPNPVTRVLRKGSQGEDVKQLQRELNRVYQTGLKVDGDFGNITHAAVIRIQKQLGLKADGIVGPKTYAAFKTKGLNL